MPDQKSEGYVRLSSYFPTFSWKGQFQQKTNHIDKQKSIADFLSHCSSPSFSATAAAKTNPRGIPIAPFVDNVTDYVSSRADVEPTLRSFQEMIAKYQFMEINTQRRGQGLREKVPDIRKTLEMASFLKTRRKVCITKMQLQLAET